MRDEKKYIDEAALLIDAAVEMTGEIIFYVTGSVRSEIKRLAAPLNEFLFRVTGWSFMLVSRQLRLDLNGANNRLRIAGPPGSRLNTFAQAFYSKKTYERVFQQWIIDWREEHAGALAQGKFRLALWRAFSGNFVFIATMVTHAASTGLRGVLKIWRMTGGG